MIKAAYLHIVRGVTQQDISTAFEVNIGRVNEAVKTLKRVCEELHKGIHD